LEKSRFSDTEKYGEPVIVVSGLPRSGTSMLMKMLKASDIEIVSDGIRKADGDNPEGYFEYEPVKKLLEDNDKSWLKEARGKAVKIISLLLKGLTAENNYKVLFIDRDLDEVIASQNKMLINRGEPVNPQKDEKMKSDFKKHLDNIKKILNNKEYFDVLYLNHREIIKNPVQQAIKINQFLGGNLDIEKMAESVNPKLYRNRKDDLKK